MLKKIRSIDKCIYCGACFEACNSIINGQSLAERVVMGIAEPSDYWYCLNCRECEYACPLNLSVREHIFKMRRETAKPGEFLEFYNKILDNGAYFSINDTVLEYRRMYNLETPMLLSQKSIYSAKKLNLKINNSIEAIVYQGCTVLYRFPEYEYTALKTLEQYGVKAGVPEYFTCCGSTILESVDLEKWIKQAALAYSILSLYSSEIVCLCGTCTSTLKRVREELTSNTSILRELESLGLKVNLKAKVKHILEVLGELNVEYNAEKLFEKPEHVHKVVIQIPCNSYYMSSRDRILKTIYKLKSGIENLGVKVDVIENCCGASTLIVDQEIAYNRVKRVVGKDDVIAIVSCPACAIAYSSVLGRSRVYFITQLVDIVGNKCV